MKLSGPPALPADTEVVVRGCEAFQTPRRECLALAMLIVECGALELLELLVPHPFNKQG